jgi:hypothetical protein
VAAGTFPEYQAATTSGQVVLTYSNSTTSAGGFSSSDPAAVNWNTGTTQRLDSFHTDISGHLQQIGSTDGGATWGSPIDLGGSLATGSAPAAVSWGTGRLDVFARGSDNALWHRAWTTSGWGSWESLGGTLTSAPSVASWGPGRMDVFVRNTSNALSHIAYDSSTWYPWESLGGTLTSAPAAVSWGPGRIDIFVRDTSNGLSQLPYQGQWYPWASLGGILTAAPAVSSPASGQLDVYVRDTSNSVEHRTFNGSWTDWTGNGVITNAPAGTAPAVISSNGHDTLYYLGTDNAIWYGQTP